MFVLLEQNNQLKIMATYEINVSLNGKHLFATHERSLQFSDKTIELTKLFYIKFPESEGYKLTISHYKTIGHTMSVDNNTDIVADIKSIDED